MHPLLARQLSRRFGPKPSSDEAFRAFVIDVAAAYREYDEQIALNDRTVTLVSQELTERNGALRAELAARRKIEEALREEKIEQAALIKKLEHAHNQLLQSEKLASIGQLAAGVAHEINNPIGYVFSNITSLNAYLSDLIRLLDAYRLAESSLSNDDVRDQLKALRSEIDLDYILADIGGLLGESQEGIGRVRRIVEDLKDFSHVDSNDSWQFADLHRGLESTLNIVANEIRYCADVVRDYDTLPQVECLPSQLNQVFMNLLVNAAHASEGRPRGLITVRTRVKGTMVRIAIADSGCGIPAAIKGRIFDPFFTTKGVGKGTGLGLSLSYGIVQKHGGYIDVESEEGVGSCFTVCIPTRRETEDA